MWLCCCTTTRWERNWVSRIFLLFLFCCCFVYLRICCVEPATISLKIWIYLLPVHPELAEIHIKLLRKLRKTVHPEKWERTLINFCYTFMKNQDAWEIERFGYKKASIPIKLKILKVSECTVMWYHMEIDRVLIIYYLISHYQALLEVQFDSNTKFKTAINLKNANELRPQPIGKDNLGNIYWYFCDERCNLFIYQENPDDETWRLVARWVTTEEKPLTTSCAH